MNIENELKRLIIENFKSLRAFTQAIQVPYSTIDTMLKKGILGTGVGTIIKVCSALNISTDELVKNKIVKLNNNVLEDIKAFQLSTVEKNIIKNYRLLDERGKAVVLDVMLRELQYANKSEISAAEIADTLKTIANEVNLLNLTEKSRKN